MQLFDYPQYWDVFDVCPVSPCCVAENNSDWQILNFGRICSYHQQFRGLGLSDVQIREIIRSSGQVREYARYAAKLHLDLDNKMINPETGLSYAATGDKYPGIPFRVDADGNFTIGIDSLGVKQQFWPTKTVDRTKLTTAINNYISNIQKPAGTSIVRIA